MIIFTKARCPACVKAKEFFKARNVNFTECSLDDKDVLDEFKKKVVDITIEKSGDFFLVYRKDDGSFLAQGADIDKLSDILTEKFPGKLFNCSPEDLATLEATAK